MKNLRMVSGIIEREKVSLFFVFFVSIIVSMLEKNIFDFGLFFIFLILLWLRLFHFYNSANMWRWIDDDYGYVVNCKIPLVKIDVENWCKENCKYSWNIKKTSYSVAFYNTNHITQRVDYIDQIIFASKQDIALFQMFEPEFPTVQYKPRWKVRIAVPPTLAINTGSRSEMK
jgi:hypothetical protein